MIPIVLAFLLLLSPIAQGSELAIDRGTTELSVASGYRHVGKMGIDHALADGLSVGGWAGVRFDRPAWTPSAGAQLRWGTTGDRLSVGTRVSGEWLGGTGGGGRMPGADLRALALVESAGRFKVHGGLGWMALLVRDMTAVNCLLSRLGTDISVSDTTALTASVELPLYQITGPNLPGIQPVLSAGARFRLR